MKPGGSKLKNCCSISAEGTHMYNRTATAFRWIDFERVAPFVKFYSYRCDRV